MKNTTIRALARLCNRKHADPALATDAFLRAATSAFRRANEVEAWRLLAFYVIKEERHFGRTGLKGRASRCERGEGEWEAIRRTGHAVASRLMMDDFYVGDKRLGDCGREDLAEAEALELAERDGHNANIQFFRRLRARLRGAATVRQAMKDAAVRKLWAEVAQECLPVAEAAAS